MSLPDGFRRLFEGPETRVDADVDTELRTHLEMKADELVDSGLRPEEAEREAARRFGDIARIRRSCRRIQSRLTRRRQRSDRWGALAMDVRFALRMFRTRPGITAVALGTLAVAIGVNTTVFTVLDSTLFRPLPYQDPDRLVVIQETRLPEYAEMWVSLANYEDWRDRSRSFVDIGAHQTLERALTGVETPKTVQIAKITPNLFPLLGVDPVLGRHFRAEEAEVGADDVAILSHRLWSRDFGGSPDIVGGTIKLDERSYRVIGVMPPRFEFPIPVRKDGEGTRERHFDVWVPLSSTLEGPPRRERKILAYASARLAPGVTLDQARDELRAIAGELEETYPRTNTRWGARVDPAVDYVAGDTRAALLLLLTAVGLVLMIASANVATLLLARAVERERELTLRCSLGASRSRLVRQLLVEGLVLGAGAAALGLLAALLGTEAVLRIGAYALPRIEWVELNGAALAYTTAATVASVLLFSLAPALFVSAWTKPSGVLRLLPTRTGGSLGATASRSPLQAWLTASQIALSVIVASGAGLLGRSFTSLSRVDPGFRTENLLVADLNVDRSRYATAPERQALYAELMERIRNLPGVVSVSAGRPVPFAQGPVGGGALEIEGVAGGQPTRTGPLSAHDVYPGYFEVMGIPVLSGRAFTHEDRRDDWTMAFWDTDAPVYVISESAARRDFPGDDPLGKRLFGARVVGVVGDVIQGGLDIGPPDGQIYIPSLQNGASPALVVRTSGNPSALIAPLSTVVASTDDELPVDFITMEDAVARSLAPRRFALSLMLALAALALVLSATGIYAVTYHGVARRTRELGIRRALGARPSDLVHGVVERGLPPTVLGVGAGLFATLLLGRWVESELFGVGPRDPVTLITVATVVLAVTVVASWVPARRAALAEAAVALRAD